MKRLIPLLIIILTLSGISQTSAQTNFLFGTRSGELLLTGKWQDSLIVAISDYLSVELNYNTAEIKISLDVGTLQSGNPELDSIFNLLGDQSIVFQGKLGIQFITYESMPPQTFLVEGNVLNGMEKSFITGIGELHHMSDTDIISSMLGIIFPLNLNSLDLPFELKDLNPEVQIIITQTVLKPLNR